jgi:DNA invertase Pin-like site-specific DNA recombinase
LLYKIDRLTRSLTGFAKIVEVMDGAGASFVSITQSFNSTTSMGRLTLNMLLSFAQFEREVTGERIRDKMIGPVSIRCSDSPEPGNRIAVGIPGA